MVTTKNGNAILIADFEGDQEGDGLNGVVATIDVVTHEQVVGIRRLSTNLEQLTQVVELSVNITANSDGSGNLLHVRLVDQNFFRLSKKS